MNSDAFGNGRLAGVRFCRDVGGRATRVIALSAVLLIGLGSVLSVQAQELKQPVAPTAAGMPAASTATSSQPASAPTVASPAPAASVVDLPKEPPPAAAPVHHEDEASPPPRHILPGGELSPFGMFLAADIVVKAVMIGLAAASFVVWTIWVAKWIQLWLAKRRMRTDLREIAGKPSVEMALSRLAHRPSLARAMLEAAADERARSGGQLHGAAVSRIQTTLAEIEASTVREVRGGMSFLATVGSTGPFVGLFGTVWGIMNSFIGISKSQTTSLAVVAPGIAEALLATAIGLVAAIPAVILYNNLGRGIGTFKRLTRETRGEVERIVSRDMESAGNAQRRFPSLASAAE